MINNFLIINFIGKDDKLGLRINKDFFIHNFKNKNLVMHHGDLSDVGSLNRIINQINPDEIYNFWINRDKADIINGNRANRDDFMYRKIYSNIAFIIYKMLFNLPIKDPSYAFVLAKRKVYEKLSNFKPEMPDGFFWEFNARASKKKFDFFNLDIVHKKRVYGVTRIYSLKNLPLVSYNNFIGMIKIKFFS